MHGRRSGIVDSQCMFDLAQQNRRPCDEVEDMQWRSRHRTCQELSRDFQGDPAVEAIISDPLIDTIRHV
jgi:hypothetical protein